MMGTQRGRGRAWRQFVDAVIVHMAGELERSCLGGSRGGGDRVRAVGEHGALWCDGDSEVTSQVLGMALAGAGRVELGVQGVVSTRDHVREVE